MRNILLYACQFFVSVFYHIALAVEIALTVFDISTLGFGRSGNQGHSQALLQSHLLCDGIGELTASIVSSALRKHVGAPSDRRIEAVAFDIRLGGSTDTCRTAAFSQA
jgi:hypothetical protein